MYDEILKEYLPAPPPEKLPETAIKLTWAGTAGFTVEYKGTTVLIDPYVTRCGGLRILFSKLYPNTALCEEIFPKADFILLGYSHFDHLLDVPSAAARTGGTVYGSPSTVAVCRAAGVEESKITVIEPRKEYQIGTLKATFIPSIHGKVVFGRVPFPGEIPDGIRLPMRASGYKTGGTYGLLLNADGFKICHFGSANLIDEEASAHGRADVLLLGISGRQKTPDFLKRMTSCFKPSFIIAHHFDNFFKPLRAGRVPFRSVGLDDFIAEYKSVCPETKLILPDFFKPVAFDTKTGEQL